MATYTIELIVTGKDHASGPLGSVSNSLSSMGNIAGGIVGAQVLMGIAEGILSIGQRAWDAVGSMQQLSMAMESVAAAELVKSGTFATFQDALGTASTKGKELMGWLKKLSVQSPFSYETVAGAFQFNASMGQSINTAKMTTKSILDFSAAVGLSQAEMSRFSYAMAQTGASGKITGMDLRQMANSRFGIQQLNGVFEILNKNQKTSIKTNNDFNRAVETGKVTVDNFFTAFSEYVSKSYGGAANRMINTIPGLMSNIGDVMFFALNDVFGPLGDQVARVLGPIVSTLGNMLDTGAFKGIGQSLTGFLQPLMVQMPLISAALKGGDWNAVGRGIMAALPPELSQNITDFIAKLGGFESALKKIGEAANILGGALAGGAVMGTLIGIAGAIALINWPLTALIALSALIGAAWAGNWGNIQGIVAGVVAYFQTSVMPLFQQLATWFQSVLPVAMAFLSNGWNILSAVVTNAIAVIAPVWQSFIAGIGESLASFAPAWAAFMSLWEKLAPVFSVICGIVGAVLAVLFSVIVGIVTGIINALNPLLQTVAAAATSLFTSVTYIGSFVKNWWNLMVGIFTGNTALIESSFLKMGQALTNIIQNMVTGVTNLFKGLWDTVKAFVQGFVDGAVGFFSGLYDTLIGHSIIPDMINGIITWFTYFATQALAIIGGAITGIQALFSQDWGAVGQQIVAGIMTMLQTSFTTLSGLINLIVTQLITVMTPLFELFAVFIAAVLQVFDALTLLFVNGIYPVITGFQKLYELIQTTIKTIVESLIPSLRKLVQELLTEVYPAIQKIIAAIGEIRTAASQAESAVRALIRALLDLQSVQSNMRLSGDYKIGSPTPAELAFLAIGRAVDSLASRSIPNLAAATKFMPSLDVAGMQEARANRMVSGPIDNSRTIQVSVVGGPDMDEEKLAAAIHKWEVLYA